MKTILSRWSVRNGARRITLGLVSAVAVMTLHLNTTAIEATVNLGTARDFAVLAGAGITVAAPVNSTTITGDIGTFPTLSISGFENVVLVPPSVNHGGDAVTQGAKDDLVIAYDDAAGRSATTSYGPIFDLGGLTLIPGVYHGESSFGITGTLELDAQGNPDAVWIFQTTASTLITAANSSVALLNGAQACHVFWQVGSSATLGTDSEFVGNILALESITATTGATVDGRLLARNGAVTLDNNTITKAVCHTIPGAPDAGSTLLLLSSGVAILFGWRRRPSAQA